MHRILSRQQLSETVFRLEVEAPLIAREHRAGQFVIVQVDAEWGERIPLTIADADPGRGAIVLVFQAVGRTTLLLAEKRVGDLLPAVVGPLGNPTDVRRFGWVACVGGGIGVAPLYPIVKAMKAAGNRVTVIMGARNRSLLILEDEMEALADERIVVTDDGSAGRKALVTGPLEELCRQDPKPDRVIAIGPPVMMKFCAETTRPFGVPTIVSLNTIMLDGTGMCGGCRVTVGGETRFVCVDGPEFDGHLVDFDNMMQRLRTFKDREDADRAAHVCRLQDALSRQAKP
ncbi:MAG: sulfide/dihydroorotate dehydrogenase-like FAD/NAD-binding protein [Kiritimatiellia bacterium]|jgi:ferredoxin--NADP+ reductase